MSLVDSLSFAWSSITKHRLRSFLALAGICVGVLAVTSVVSLERSWRQTVDRAFEGMDLNLLEVRIPRVTNLKAVDLTRTELTDEDAEAIRKHCSAIERLTVYTVDYGEIHRGRARPESPSIVYAIEPSFTDLFGLRAFEGWLLGDDALQRGLRVCMISPSLREVLFSDRKAIQESLRLEGVSLRVEGIAAQADYDPSKPVENIYIPRKIYRQVFRKKPETRIRARAHDPDLAIRQIDALMRQRVGGTEKTSFVESPWLAREIARHVRSRVQSIGFLAALCALMLGGYGVGSLLYISITENAREIGIRRAIGATRSAVALEVVFAGLMLGAVGTIVGIGLSNLGVSLAAISGAALPPKFQHTLSEQAGFVAGLAPRIPSQFSATISWGAVLVASIFSTLICFVASLEPAFEAANLNPAQVISAGMPPHRHLRLAVTVVQICIAVAAISLLPSLYEALDQRDRREVRGAFRSDVVYVTAYDKSKTRDLPGGRKPPGWDPRIHTSFRKALVLPTLSDDLLAACPLLTSVEPRISFIPSTVKVSGRALWPRYGANVSCPSIYFVRPTYYPRETGPTGRNWPGHGHIKYGDFFTEAMARAKQRVCVLDSEAMKLAFSDTNGVGETVRINGVPLQIVGAMAGGAVSGRWGGSERVYGASIFVPIALYEELLPALISNATWHLSNPTALRLTVHAADEESVPKAAQQLRQALNSQLPGLGEKLFISEPTYGSLREYFALRGPAAKRSVFSTAMLLLVALIGVANTLLVSLHEQIRELGIRRALGALKSQVMLPILTEAAWLAALASVLGISLAWFLAWAIRATVSGQLSISLSLFWAVAACFVMFLTSLAVALIPASLAAKVNPAVALKYE